MTPFYQADAATLFRGDALAVLATLPDASVDALITDPPYSSGGMVRGDRTQDVHTKYVTNDSRAGLALSAFTGDNRDQRSHAYWMALWLSECLRIVRPGGVCIVFSDWRQLPTTTDAIQAGGFVWRGVVPWHKPAARPQQGRFTAACEYVVWGSHGAHEMSGSPLPGFYQANAPSAQTRDHITQKPVEVMRELVKIVPTGGVVLDPFMGAGTTGVAALIEGRQFVGVEMTEHFAGVAARRIREASGQAVPGVEQGALELTA